MVSSLTKGVLNVPPRYMPKHVSGDTDVNTTLRNKKNYVGVYTRRCRHFLLLEKHTFRFGR
jgi:hypothetical protein